MDRIETEKTYPQKVEVTNNINAVVETSADNPVNVAFPQDLINGVDSNSALKVFPTNTSVWIFSRPYPNNFNLHISSLHVVNASVGSIFPIDLMVYNLSSSAVVNNVNAVYTSYASRYPSASSIVIFYEKISNSGSVEASSYSATD